MGQPRALLAGAGTAFQPGKPGHSERYYEDLQRSDSVLRPVGSSETGALKKGKVGSAAATPSGIGQTLATTLYPGVASRGGPLPNLALDRHSIQFPRKLL